MPALWNINSQPRRVFGWTDILASWDDSLTMPPYVQTVIDNLRAVSDTNSNRDYPLEHFTNFLNDEQDGLKWFLYELITMRWMWGDARLDYVRHLVDEIEDLDSFFPNFVGSPRQTQTVREFIERNLNDDEQEFVNMLPSLVSAQQAYIPPVQRCAPPAEQTDVARFPPITLRFLRKSGARDTRGKKDDVLSIYKTRAGYNLVYNDKDSDVKTYTRDLTQEQVLQRLSNSLRLVTLDEDPFDSVQLLVPNAPSILLGPDALTSSVRDLFYDTIEAAMEEWPSTR
jgi:hypothetical protein